MNSESDRSVLILGAGLVSAPVVEYLCRDEDLRIRVCSPLRHELERLAARFSGIETIELDAFRDIDRLKELCSESYVVVSLLPSHLHGIVAECCVDSKSHMVTASYVSEDIRRLHER